MVNHYTPRDSIKKKILNKRVQCTDLEKFMIRGKFETKNLKKIQTVEGSLQNQQNLCFSKLSFYHLGYFGHLC